jgi:outer membrane lipopolysaccharide assembly protein LptE/RlpB
MFALRFVNRRLLLAGWMLMLSVALSACGFHLRGMDAQGQLKPLPFQQLALQSAPQTDPLVAQTLRQRLQAQGVQWTDGALFKLVLAPTRFQRSTTASDGNGQTTAELLKMVQPFQLKRTDTDEVVLSGQAVSFRDRTVNPAALLASERDLAAQKRLMAAEVANDIQQRLTELDGKQLEQLEQKASSASSKENETDKTK